MMFFYPKNAPNSSSSVSLYLSCPILYSLRATNLILDHWERLVSITMLKSSLRTFKFVSESL